MEERKKTLLDMYANELTGDNPTRIDVGYVGYSNKKFTINSDTDLEKVFERASLHASKCPVFFVVEASEDEEDDGDRGMRTITLSCLKGQYARVGQCI